MLNRKQCLKFHSTLRRFVHQVQAVLLASSATRSSLRPFFLSPSALEYTPKMPAERFLVEPARLVFRTPLSLRRRRPLEVPPRGRAARARGRSVRRSVNRKRARLMPTPGKGPKTPTPPSLIKRRSSELSREERGSIDSFDQSGSDRVLRSSSLSSVDDEIYTPDVTRRLFGGGQAREQWSRTWCLQWTVVVCLLALAMWAWAPVLGWIVSRREVSAGPHEGAHVHIFHENRCSGESLTLVANEARDLCGLRYPSGEEAKDNVASVMIVGQAWELRVYGTCKIADRPADPMLLETLREQGCVDLRYPICGSVEFVPAVDVEL